MSRFWPALLIVASLLGCSLGKEGTMPLDGSWLFRPDSLDVGVQEKWFTRGSDRTGWESVEVPNYWDRYNLPSYDGAAWYAKRIRVEDSVQAMALFFGGVDDDTDVWINGVHAGSHVGYSESFYLDVTHAISRGENEIVVRVWDRGGPGGIYKPVSLIPLARVQELLRSKYADLPARPSEPWVKDAVIYEVYLRSFSKEGTFQALERRLPELKRLGVTVLWLMPIHPTGELNRKGSLGSPYSIRDYYEVNPEFGTLDDFKSLVEAVHGQGMKIIIDLVANHTAWDSKLVMEHSDWFTTDEEGNILAPNANWTDVADLNYDHHELRKYMIEMMKYWVRDVGIDGYRCDVAELVPTDFWEVARRELDKIKPVMMLSEGTWPEHHMMAFDVTYAWNTYDVLEKMINGSTTASVIKEILKNESNQFPKGSLRMRFNTNHDKNAWDAPAVEKFGKAGSKATAVLMFTLPGVPLIYNGEEVGNEKRLSLFEKVDIDWTKNPDLRDFCQSICTLRSVHPALRAGEFRSLSNSDSSKVLSFLRVQGGDRVATIINFSKAHKEVSLKLPEEGPWVEYFGNRTLRMKDGSYTVSLGPLGYSVLVAKGLEP